MLKSELNRREVVMNSAGAGAALSMSPVGAVSFVDEGTEKSWTLFRNAPA